MPRFNAFSRNMNTVNLNFFSHTWWNIKPRENSVNIAEGDSGLRILKKYDRVYP